MVGPKLQHRGGARSHGVMRVGVIEPVEKDLWINVLSIRVRPLAKSIEPIATEIGVELVRPRAIASEPKTDLIQGAWHRWNGLADGVEGADGRTSKIGIEGA